MKEIFFSVSQITDSFRKDDCYAKASSLAFYSLLSIVPLLAVIFGIAQGFGFEKALHEELSMIFFQQHEVNDKLTQFATSWLQNVKGGVIAGVGTIVLFWGVISLLNNIENSFNQIWKIRIGRSYVIKIRDYLTLLIIAPLFFVTASSINIYLITQITETAQNYSFLQAVSPFLLFLLKLFPFFLIWCLFTFMYIFTPNTKVNFYDAFIAGLLAGTAFQIWQWIYIHFQIKISAYGAIYGSFAALPLFLVWLQFSWLIILGGAEIAANIKNGIYLLKRKQQPIPAKIVGLMIVYWCVKSFANAESPPTELELQRKLGISLNDLQVMLETLTKNHILSETSFADNSMGYHPARSIEDITIQMVCDAIEQTHEIPASIEDKIELHKMENLTSKNQMTSDSSKSFYSLVKNKK
jgi:membrane protein